jgi:hypothetical protein
MLLLRPRYPGDRFSLFRSWEVALPYPLEPLAFFYIGNERVEAVLPGRIGREFFDGWWIGTGM